MDLGHLWRTRQARRALNLIDHLPPTSHYLAAVANDEDVARQILARGQAPTPSAHPPLTEWTPEVAAMVALTDALLSFRWVFMRFNGAKVPAPQPQARPQTALQRVKARQREDRNRMLSQRLLGRPPT